MSRTHHDRGMLDHLDRAMRAILVAARTDAGLTQRTLAARLGRAHSFVGKVEKGRRQLTVVEFCEVAAALGVDPRDLFATMLSSRARQRGSE